MSEEKTLKTLMHDTNEILKVLFPQRHTIDGAINWADLSCTQVAKGITDLGLEFWAVWIEEAAPDNWEFQEEIRQRLFGMNYDLVRVYTEW